MAQRISCHLIPVILLRLCLLCSLIAINVLSATQAPQKNVTTLEPGLPIERDLKGGEAHTFQVKLASGQFLHVVVDQRGVDVVVTLLRPGGEQVARADSPNGSYGPEPVVVAAAESGDYRLEVSSPNKNAPAGRYEIKILALREATPTDSNHVAAERAFEQAQKLRVQGTAASRREAIEKYQRALQFFQASGNRYRQALTLYIVGNTHAALAEFGKALEYFDQALPLFRAVGDRLREISTLNSIGGAYDTLGNLQEALKYYEQALSMSKHDGERYVQAAILNNIGKVHHDLADWQKALNYYSQTLPIFRTLGDQRKEANALHNIGAAYWGLNDAEKALEYYLQALPLRSAAGDKAGEAYALSNIGLVYARLGKAQTAMEYYNQAFPLWRATGDRVGEAFTLDYAGMAHSALGEREKALEFHRQALQLQRAIEDRRGEAITLGNIGYVYTLLGQPQSAIEHYNQALTIIRGIGDRQNEARMLQGIARAERDRGNLDEARRQIHSAITLFEEVRARVGSEQLRASYFASRQDAYQFYVDLLMRMHAREPAAGHNAVALQTSERARARSLLEMLAEARVDIRQGVDAALLQRERELARQLNAKAQRLTGRNTPQQRDELKKEISQLETEHQQTQAAIRKNNPHYSAITQPEPLGLEEIQKQVLGEGVLLLEYALGEERSYLWAVTGNSITSYELPGRDRIDKAARQVTDLLVARSVRKRGETQQQQRERIAQADAQLPAAARQLSEMALGPAAGQLGGKQLLIVADGALQYVPFAMLPEPETRRPTPLIVNHEIVSLPSASTLAVLRKELSGRKAAPKMLAVIADPVFAGDDERFKARNVKIEGKVAAQTETTANTRIIEHLAESGGATTLSGKLAIPRLPFTRAEADRILAVAPATANLKALDFKANRATAMSAELGEYRYLHFATHGLLDSERPGLSALVLSLVDENGRPQDGFLRAHEIYNLNLPADLVVLSACQTGLGKEVKGEGLIGLTRGFMYAGAARVVVSLWNVNDKATSELMAKFYRKMLKEGRRPAAALKSAQVEMWRQKQWQAPYYWAAFVLQGEWR